MAVTPAIAATLRSRGRRLNSNQIKGFWAAWGGWCLDGMDAFIYSLVLVPALTELLPKSGIPATPGNIGYYGSILFALFLAGWGMSMVWGPIADRFGRVKALMMTILMYSFFTFACGLAQNVWQLAVLRVFCGIGLGGEQPIGGTFIAEEWPEDRRKMGAGYMHTGYYFGFFLAALANYVIGVNFGWRWMFVLGGTPALLVGWIQSGVHESAAWKAKFENPAARPTHARFVRGALQPALLEADDHDVAALHGVDHRPVGRIDLRADCGDADCAARGTYSGRRGAPGVVCGRDSRRSARSSAVCWRPARRTSGSSSRDGDVLRADVHRDRVRLRTRVLHAERARCRSSS